MEAFTEEQQIKVDSLIGEARTKARGKAEAEFQTKQIKANEEAERAKLVASEATATQKARITELESFESQVSVYRELVSGILKQKVEALGDAAKKAVGALPKTMGAVEKLNWLNENEALFSDSPRQVIGTPTRSSKSEPKRTHSNKRLRL